MIKKAIKIIGAIELLIGASTIFGVTTAYLLHLSQKSPAVFVFVLASAITSSIIGGGILTHKRWARTLLVFFSGYIVVTKVLIFADLMHFNGAIVTFVPTGLKNYVSVVYHICVLLFFTKDDVREEFKGI